MLRAFILFTTILFAACSHKEAGFEESDLFTADQKTTGTPTSCSYQGTSYKIGESFASVDGCNECQCNAGDKVICTLKNCELMKMEAKKARDRLRQFHHY